MGTPVVTVDNVVSEIAGHPVHAPVSLQLAAAQLGVLTGGNGSGKTSLLRAISGELRITSGSVRICGEAVRFGSTWRLTRSFLRMIPQFPMHPPDLTIREYLNGWYLCRPVSSWDVNLGRVTEELEEITGHSRHTALGTLSHGQRRLVDIRLSLYARPQLLLADEPLAGLSQQRLDWCVALLGEFRRQGGTLLVVAHTAERHLWNADCTREVLPA